MSGTSQRSSGGPPYMQPMTPVVEVWLGNKCLSHKAGKPYRVLSLEHNSFMQGKGLVNLSLFDPEWMEVEHLLVDRRSRYGSRHPMATIFVRYGYTGHGGPTVWATIGGAPGAYLAVLPIWYTVAFRNWGCQIDISGMAMSSVTQNQNGFVLPPCQPNQDIAQYLSDMCDQFGLEKDFVWDEKPEYKPMSVPTTDEGYEDTEAKRAAPVIPAHSDDITQTVTYILSQTRPKSAPGDVYKSSIESYLVSSGGGPVNDDGTLNGEVTCKLKVTMQTPDGDTVRKYTYISDRKTDVIDFTPRTTPALSEDIGGAGLVLRCVDSRTGEQLERSIDQRTAKLTKFPRRDNKVIPKDGLPRGNDTDPPPPNTPLEGFSEHKEEIRGTNVVRTDTSRANSVTHVKDVASAEMAAINAHLDAWKMLSSSGTLTVIGDPELQDVGKMIYIKVLLPERDRKGVLVHYSSGYYTIYSITHSISPGSGYTTTLELVRGSENDGSTGEMTARQTKG